MCLLAVTLVTSCAGRTPHPIPEHYPTDHVLTCIEIRAQEAAIDREVAALLPKTDKTGHNLLLGATGGLALGIPWFFMDFTKSEQIEIDAYRRRYLVLQQLETEKHCAEPLAPPDA
jgi:hypothetical protein